MEKQQQVNQEKKPRILIGASGSVDIMLLPRYLQVIKSAIDCELTVLMTPTAETFIPASSMALYCDRVIAGERPGDWPTDKPSRIVADHDVLMVMPATANTLATAAHGGATNRLTTVILAADFPVYFLPVMGSVMWKKPAVERNVRQLREDGYVVVEPVWHENFDASLQRMVGHPSLPAPEVVAELVQQALANS
ncbi:flavoprotein [Photobacterium galatheae]|uniref:Flavoprotein n=2 Tax=Photobacterium galatheae TaxID=1654360 RepID=A0A066RHA2_9GAMM|nr:flavoprotein [Photobacterium galatheae]KDM89825.1 flavoprotein [Photobacterium galatheae]